jgi:hypothetical protein
LKQSLLGTGLALPPLAWFASMEANFALAPLACSQHQKGILLLVSGLAFGLVVASGLLAWTQRDFRRRLAVAGIVLSALFTLVIVAQAIPNLILGGCE